MIDEQEVEKLLMRITTIWFKAIDGMLVDMHTGEVIGLSHLDGFGLRYKIPKLQETDE